MVQGRCWLAGFDVLLFMLGVVLLAGVLEVLSLPLTRMAQGMDGIGSIVASMWEECLLLLAVLGASAALLRLRKVPFRLLGLAFQKRAVAWGLLSVAAFYGVAEAVVLLSGSIEVVGFQLRLGPLFLSLVFYLLVALAEEVMVRGFVLGRMLWGGVAPWGALCLSSLLFSCLHLLNPHFAFLPFLNIFLAGIFLGIPYLYTRNLTMSVVMHWWWNWLQGPLLGYPVSGYELGGESSASLLLVHLPEANLMNGGAFGFEASLLCSVLLAAGSVGLYLWFGKYRSSDAGR